MVKKGVPEWLNSSLWYSTPSHEDDERVSRYSTRPATISSYSPELAVEPPPVPQAPPPSTRVEPAKLAETEDSPTNDNHSSDLSYNGISEVAGPSTEDISRQSQLLAEVSPSPTSLLSVKCYVYVYVNRCGLVEFIQM